MAGAGIRKFTWNPARARAAELLADDVLTDEAIAAQVGVTRQALAKWKRHPEFAARIAERRAAQIAAVEAEGLANKQNRIAAYNDRWRRMRELIEARGREMAEEIAGGETGLLVREAKIVKVYDVKQDAKAVDEDGEPVEVTIPQKRVELVYEYPLDAALLAELRQLEKQAAQDLGQWTRVIEDRRGFDEAVERLARDRGLDAENAARLKDFAAERAKRLA